MDLGHRDIGRGIEDVVVAGEGSVAEQRRVPAERPQSVQIELAGGAQAAAQLHVARVSRALFDEGFRIELVDAGHMQRVVAGIEPVPPFGVEQQALLGVERRREGEIVVRRQRPEIGHLGKSAERRFVAGRGEQEATLALDGRIRRREGREIGHGDAEKLEPRRAEIDHVLVVVDDDARRLHLPHRSLFRLFEAGFAGSVDAAIEGGRLAVLAQRSFRREMRLRGRVELQCRHEAGGEVLRDVDRLGIDHRAGAVDDLDAAFGGHRLVLLVVGDFLRLERVAVIIHLDAADRRNGRLVIVVVEAIRLEQHLRAGRRLEILVAAEAERSWIGLSEGGAGGGTKGCKHTDGQRGNKPLQRASDPTRLQAGNGNPDHPSSR